MQHFLTLPGCEETHAAGPKPEEKRRVGVGELTPLCKKMRTIIIMMAIHELSITNKSEKPTHNPEFPSQATTQLSQKHKARANT